MRINNDKTEKNDMPEMLFHKILYAYDSSEGVMDAFKLALAIAKQNGGELHVVSVGEIDYLPLFVGDIREQRGVAVQRLRSFIFRARVLAAGSDVKLHSHVLVGRPVRAIVGLALELNAELLVIGARGHSALYERLVGSRAAQIMQMAHCPVLAVKSPGRRSRVKNRTLNQLAGAGDQRHSVAFLPLMLAELALSRVGAAVAEQYCGSIVRGTSAASAGQ